MAHRARQPRRESAEQTRLELLEAGAALLREQPVGDVFSQVKAADVARRAGGRSIGAIYHHWRDQEAYRQDLLAYICRPERVPSIGDPEVQAQAAAAEAERLQRALELADLIRVGGNAVFAGMQNNPFVVLQVAIWSKHQSDPLAKSLQAEHLYGPTEERMVPLYERVLGDAGRRLRPPLTAANLATVITALADGLTLRHSLDPQSVPGDLSTVAGDEGPGTRWSLFAATSYTLIMGLTEPVAPGDGAAGSAQA
jgi:AcrR family transcriptional regulator